MTLKQPIEIRSVKTGHFTVHATLVGDVSTADLFHLPRRVRVVNNVSKEMTIGLPAIDIRDINRALREPQEPTPELTSVNALASTR
jgi:hypothetical protein